MENIKGMTLEMDELKAQLNTMELSRKNSEENGETNYVNLPSPVKDYNSPEMREKRRVKRVNKLDELIKTEQFYLRDLKLCVQVFNSPTGLQAPEAVDKDTLFGYIDVIIRISEKLLGMLEASMENVEFDSQVIGKAFLELQEEMKESYSLYTKNYDEVTQLLEQYKTNGDVRAYFAEGLDMIAKHRPEKPFTVDAFLITPVQRIPRYIMLLLELFETTEATHPDKEPLQLAKNSQQEVADYVNEFKRRTDIAQLHTMESLRKNSEKNVETNGVHVPPSGKDYNSPEMREKRRVKRVNQIDELIKTEQSYLRDLKLCVQVFNSPTGLQAPDAVDKETLFGYMTDIIPLSEQLLGMLEASVEDVEFDAQVIGKAFLELQKEMKESYALYTRNYDEVTQLLKQYKINEDVQEYFTEGLDIIAKHRPEKLSTIDAFLITPVQRIPRYIMLLMELSKSTEATHPDKEQVELAGKSQKEIADYVNEFKRRTDIVRKYKSTERDEDRLSRISMHSFRKKTTRVSRRIGNYVGLSPQYVDEDFDKEVAYCKDLEASIRDLTKNLEHVLSNLKSCHDTRDAVSTDISEYMKIVTPKEVKEHLLAQQRMSSTAFKQFKSEVEFSVYNQLLKVLVLFQGPSKLITKNGDKRLDFDSAHSKFENNKDDKVAKAELDKAQKDFHALNAQLKEELPKFNSLVYDIFKDSISELSRLYRTYFSESYRFILPLLELPSMKCSPGSTAIMDRFERDYATSERMLTMSSDPKLRKVSESRGNFNIICLPPAGVQSPEIRSQLTSKYPPNKLYKAISSYSPLEAMEVGLSLGDLVGVLQQKDPMGNDERWYIDNGATMGLVKKSILQPVRDEPDSQPIKPLWSPLLSPASPHKQQPQSPQIDQASPPPSYDQLHEAGVQSPEIRSQLTSKYPPNKLYKAISSYSPLEASEVGLSLGDLVGVIQQKDPMGNEERWCVDNGAIVGFVKKSVLQPVRNVPDSLMRKLPGSPLLSPSSPRPQLPQSSQIGRASPTPSHHQLHTAFQALYDFLPRNANELLLKAGQIVHVHRKYDEHGNSKWWYAQSSNGIGYAPANYLTPYNAN